MAPFSRTGGAYLRAGPLQYWWPCVGICIGIYAWWDRQGWVAAEQCCRGKGHISPCGAGGIRILGCTTVGGPASTAVPITAPAPTHLLGWG
jgi:hypothetical protein